MKKIFILFLAFSIIGCSKEEEDAPVFYKDQIEFISHSWEKVSENEGLVKIKINAIIKNGTKEDVTGKIVFIRYRDIDDPSDSNTWVISKNITFEKGTTKKYSEIIEDEITIYDFNQSYDEVLLETTGSI